MNESVTGIVLGLAAVAGVAYVGMKVRQHQEKMRHVVGIVDHRHVHQIADLFRLVDAGELALFDPAVAT